MIGAVKRIARHLIVPDPVYRRRLHGLLLLAVLIAAAPVAAEDRYEGQPIVRIEVKRYNIFDTTKKETASWPYRAANALHIVSREGFIRSMLLFQEGDSYSADQAEESARILRSLGFINPVTITPYEVEGGVEVVVVTRDQWTLEVGAQLGFFGNRSDLSVTFEEDNFLGTGREISLEYESDDERDTWIFGFFDPNLFATRWRARLAYEDSTDGYREWIKLEYPFYSLKTKQSWGIEWDDHEAIDYLYSEGKTRVTGTSMNSRWRVWGGLRLARDDDTVARRLVLGWEHQRRRYQDWAAVPGQPDYPTPEDRTISGVRVEYQRIPDRFIVLQGFRAWWAQEDISLGPNLRVGMVLSLPAFGGDRTRVLLDGRLSAAHRHDGWLFLGDGWWAGRFDEGEARNWRAGIQLIAAQLGHRGWQARLRVETTHRADDDVQLTLGADTGLRGWNPDYFDGTGRAVANLQWRTLLHDDVFHLLALGAVAFVDLGHTWGARVGTGTGRVRADIGVGLLADLKQIGLANLLRLDIALPDDGTGVVISVSASSLF